MRSRLTAAIWLVGLASIAPAQFAPQVTFKYKCAEGRFRVSFGKNVWHYCYDGTYYSEKTLPADIRAYFDDMDRRMKESQAKFKDGWAQHEQRMAEYDADRAAKGLPTRAEMAESVRQRHIANGGKATTLTPRMSASRGYGATGSGGTVESSRKPDAEPIKPDALKAVAAGTTAADLVAALGEPPGKVATGDNAESWTYVLTTGAFAKVKMEGGAVKEVVLPD